MGVTNNEESYTQMDSKVEDNSLLAANLWSVYNFGNPNDRYDKFLARGRPAFKSLIESILLYDKVVIPTQDFLSLAILVGVLGERAILDMLESDRIKFLRLKGALTYVGNGGGIQAIQDVHSLQDRIKYVQYAEREGFEAISTLDLQSSILDPLRQFADADVFEFDRGAFRFQT